LQLADRSDLQTSVKQGLCERIDYERGIKFPLEEEEQEEWGGAVGTHISPTTPAGGFKRARDEIDEEMEQGDEEVVEELEEVENVKPVKKKSVNPFKKSVVSPTKKKKMGFDAILSPSPAKMSQPELSRSSTFSANSRMKSRSAKRVL